MVAIVPSLSDLENVEVKCKFDAVKNKQNNAHTITNTRFVLGTPPKHPCMCLHERGVDERCIVMY